MKKIFLLIILSGLCFLSIVYYINSSPSMMQKTHITVKYGQTLRQVSKNLKRNNLIKSSDFFVYLSYLLRRKHIKAGKYEILPEMSSADILRKMTRGEMLSRKVTIPEGFNLWQIAERLDDESITESSAFLKFSFDREFLSTLQIPASSAEGYLFPDTYVFAEGSDARDVIKVMNKKLRRVIAPYMKEHGKSWKDMHKILILASLIEKEARIPGERVYVSSVFHNRIKKRMKLDCDPTVRYAVKRFDKPIRVSDLKSDSPYNTYRRHGLPPTPICASGKAAISAAIKPKKTKYLYFVARNDGSHYFSKTLKEHNRAVQHYQRGGRTSFIDNQRL